MSDNKHWQADIGKLLAQHRDDAAAPRLSVASLTKQEGGQMRLAASSLMSLGTGTGACGRHAPVVHVQSQDRTGQPDQMLCAFVADTHLHSVVK